jgi:hypothetical protein
MLRNLQAGNVELIRCGKSIDARQPILTQICNILQGPQLSAAGFDTKSN